MKKTKAKPKLTPVCPHAFAAAVRIVTFKMKI
ncbi:hypothetical protein VPHD530_0049 [Vibrio phage D530]